MGGAHPRLESELACNREGPALKGEQLTTVQEDEDRSELEEASFLSTATDPCLPGLRWLPPAIPTAAAYETKPRAIGARQERVQERSILTMALRAGVLRRAFRLAPPLANYSAAASACTASHLRCAAVQGGISKG
jgi:hypothetical protein